MKELRIEWISIDDIHPAPYNPRVDLQPTDPAYQKLKKSIETFGLVDPLIWNKRSRYLVGGHQRFKVAKELGYTKVPCAVVDLDEQQEKALNVTLNKVGGDWNEELLATLLEELDEDLLTLTGFYEEELDELLTSLPDAQWDDLDADEEEIDYKKADVKVTIGSYHFLVEREVFEEWLNEIQLAVGFDRKSIHQEIKQRLGFHEIS
ncbi:ParB N-terminal domain-containing protein [Laceyella putida]|uniref:ParB N-terminal domain-containing protein n=1 Tax=Laceyella putida TaxID=110101 RepID=A0ABW2RRD7_9BACL